jgi:long-subunit acyl-CoA synthetase (AMP-forming)
MQSVIDALARNAAERPDAIAFAGDGETLTWAQLAAAIATFADQLENAPHCVGIGLAGGCSYVVADLALTITGRRQVPLPFFFGAEQIRHVLADAQVGAIITERPEAFGDLPLQTLAPPELVVAQGAQLRTCLPGADRVIYTSGSSGRPKGVIIGSRQLSASFGALLPVVAPRAQDRHLSVLPLAQLLEQICGIFLPILVGAETRFDFSATRALFGADIAPLTAAFEREQPTTSLLAPALLGRWVADLRRQSLRAPDSLRFVAVGGAPSSPALLEAAWACGVPVHEGYGLSECCAVVAMNRPGANAIGTVGQILDGLDVQIIDGEITVAGPTVMNGYLNGPSAPVRWHTGDLGRIDNGRLIVDGRKDALIVTGAGRNISPEWVERRVDADPRVVASALGLHTDGALVLIVAAIAPLGCADIETLLEGLPHYARPEAVIFTTPTEPGLLFPAGTPNRTSVARIINERQAQPLFQHPESLAS